MLENIRQQKRQQLTLPSFSEAVMYRSLHIFSVVAFGVRQQRHVRVIWAVQHKVTECVFAVKLYL